MGETTYFQQKNGKILAFFSKISTIRSKTHIIGTMKKPSDLSNNLFTFMYSFLKGRKSAAFLIVILSSLAGLWGPINAVLIKRVIDLLPFIQGNDISVIYYSVFLIVINFIILDHVCWRVVTLLQCKHIPSMLNSIVGKLMDAVLKQSRGFFQDNMSGQISKQIANLEEACEKLLTTISFDVFRCLSWLLSSLSIAYLVNPVFFWILLSWSMCFVIISLYMSKQFTILSEEKAFADSLVSGELIDTVANQNVVRIFSARVFENRRIAPFFLYQQKAFEKTYKYAFYMQTVQGALIAIMLGFCSYFLASLYSQHLVTAGDFALIFGLTIETGHMMWNALSTIDEFNKSYGKSKKSLCALLSPLEVEDFDGAIDLVCKSGEIRFKDVQFGYKNGKKVFKNHNVTIAAKQKIGLVGYSGSGKSTFTNLILRLYDVNGGKIEIDGCNVKDITQDSLHANITVISQDTGLFQRSLRENIAYGNPDATEEQIIDAAKKAFAHNFISQLPDGYDTLVGEHGVKLSGGQRAQIAIARAILKNALILILDEATARLDSITEKLIQKSLDELMKDKTVIIIAHKLATLKNMDRILVFNKGTIVEDGRHEDLLEKNSLYKQIWNLQGKGFIQKDGLPSQSSWPSPWSLIDNAYKKWTVPDKSKSPR